MSFIYGDSLKNNTVAVVVPDATYGAKWAADKGVAGDIDSLCKNEDFKKEIIADLLKLATANKLSSLEKPKKYLLHPEEFSVDNELLTPTFKLKRNVCGKYFEKQIGEMYAEIEKEELARAQ